MPSRQVIVIRILLGLLDSGQQLLLVVLIDELAGLFTLISHQPCVSPLFGHRPDLDALGLGG